MVNCMKISHWGKTMSGVYVYLPSNVKIAYVAEVLAKCLGASHSWTTDSDNIKYLSVNGISYKKTFTDCPESVDIVISIGDTCNYCKSLHDVQTRIFSYDFETDCGSDKVLKIGFNTKDNVDLGKFLADFFGGKVVLENTNENKVIYSIPAKHDKDNCPIVFKYFDKLQNRIAFIQPIKRKDHDLPEERTNEG